MGIIKKRNRIGQNKRIPRRTNGRKAPKMVKTVSRILVTRAVRVPFVLLNLHA
jgi:hypothetical protein